MEGIYTVSIAGKRYSPEFQMQDEFYRAWQSALRKHHANGEHVYCLCDGHSERELIIRHYSSTNTFGLARMPGKGRQHSPDCRFHELADNLSIHHRYKGAVRVTKDGKTAIVPRMGVANSDIPASSGEEAEIHITFKDSHLVLSLLGLGHLLFEDAGLNKWWPKMAGHRTEHLVWFRLSQSSRDIICDKLPLFESTLFPAYRNDEKNIKDSFRKINGAIAGKRRLFVVAPLAKFTEKTDKRLHLFLSVFPYFGLPILYMNKRLWLEACNKYPMAYAAWKSGHRVVAIAQIEPRVSSGKYSASVTSIALIPTTQNWIPASGADEIETIRLATEQGRPFVRTLSNQQDAIQFLDQQDTPQNRYEKYVF